MTSPTTNTVTDAFVRDVLEGYYQTQGELIHYCASDVERMRSALTAALSTHPHTGTEDRATARGEWPTTEEMSSFPYDTSEYISLTPLSELRNRSEAREEWQPIETAPKDGSYFDCWFVLQPHPNFGGGGANRWANCKYNVNCSRPDHIHGGPTDQFPAQAYGWKPTNWMPLPKPPSSSERSERLPHPHTGGREAVIEECAAICDAWARDRGSFTGYETLAERNLHYEVEAELHSAAKAIRALSPPLQKTQKE